METIPKRQSQSSGSLMRAHRRVRVLAGAFVTIALVLGPCRSHATDESASVPRYRGDDAVVGIHRIGIAQSPPQSIRTSLRTIDRRGADPRAVALDLSHGRVYWTEHAAGKVRSARLDGSEVRDVADGLDGPVGIAVDASAERVYWTTDGEFPRRLQSLALRDGEIEDLVSGEDVNRPGAIFVDSGAEKLYWLESVSGRLRRANVDGSSIDELLEQRLLAGFGLALDDRARVLYWTDLANGVLQSGRLDRDGLSEVATLLGPTDGLDAPTGLALDREAGKLYFADAGSRTIRRCDVDGSDLTTIVAPDAGLLDPRGLALDPKGHRLYVADAGTDEILSVALDGSDFRTLAVLDGAFDLGAAAKSDAAAPADACTAAMMRTGPSWARRLYVLAAVCLDKAELTKAVKWRAADMTSAVGTCLNQLADVGVERAANTVAADRSPAQDLAAACAGRSSAKLAALVESAPLLDVADVRECGASLDVDAWSRCLADAYERVAWEAVAIDYPRTLELLEEIRPFASRAETSGVTVARRTDGLAGIDRLYAEVARITGADRVAVVDGNPFPASGLTSAYGADKNDGIAGPVAVPDDGSVRAGAPLRLVDNGDGTVSDLNTGLMWEKKCDDCGGLHDAMVGFRWSGDGGQQTVWDWLDDINEEGDKGFAGYDDWRLPNVKELASIVDYARFNPAVSRQFDAALCGLGCVDLSAADCSCTAQGNYWTATTFSDFPAHAYVVGFHLGLIADQPKTERFFVRAVRGGPQVAY